ncbi:DNA internalization-related competence protein ComEC/Rec2 [Paraburkholderia sp.]|uniref:DNA internalization-related competence protein ComEC/Rec2 n=1 Tax=Paraburkholderia sp. TaxID=1926495 RepID=UPI0023901AE5|nr:DNA internalization-related competence protein ComEC/Rec2 [Paraburkholderia sp.]MDE1183935.1 DNA internalization-related competence protein ComEC/Rec2 [Paraburkholderia sp.]
MRAVLCGFALGVFALQRQPMLPGALAWCALVGGCVGGAVLAAWLSRESAGAVVCDAHGRVLDRIFRFGRWRVCVVWTALWTASACAGFGYAAARAEWRLVRSLPLEWEGRSIGLTGSIKGLPSRDEAGGARFLFVVDSTHPRLPDFPRIVQLSWRPSDDGVPPPILEPGARWNLTARLKRPHGNANAGVRDPEAALLARNVRATGYVADLSSATRLAGRATGFAVAIDRWRASLRARIGEVLGDAPHRGIVVALSVGAQDDIRDTDWQLMRRTGTSHLVAISGLHIGFAAGLAGWLAGALWRRSCFIGRDWPLRVPAPYVAVTVGALFAAAHAALAGFNVPAQRALWMLGVVALAFVSGRSVASSLVLAWALGLVLLIDPWAVVAPGFWLSFCAVAAILFALSGRPRRVHRTSSDDTPEHDVRLPLLRRWRDVSGRWCRAGFERIHSAAHVQFAVTIALAPLTVYWFSQIPLIGPLANAFAIPWVSLFVTPAVLTGIALPQPLDAYAWRSAHGMLTWLVRGLQHVSGPSWTLWHVAQPGAWTLAAAALGVIWCLAPKGWPLRWAAPLTWLPLLMPPSSAPSTGAFRLTALDVGQGSSVLIETAHHTLLFDAGPGPESTHAGERIVVPYLQARGIDTLDTLIVSHADSDHSGGAPAVLDGVGVAQLLGALPPDHPLWTRARTLGATTVRCVAGQRWQWDGVEFAMLWPDAGPLTSKPNAHCCVLRVKTVAVDTADDAAARRDLAREPLATRQSVPRQAPEISALLAADIEAPAERTLLARDRDALRADVLVVPHHGSRTSSTEPFLDAIGPLVALFQVGYRNRFHHPQAGVFERYLARKIPLARSDSDGAVSIDAQGATLSISRYRETHRRYWMDR